MLLLENERDKILQLQVKECELLTTPAMYDVAQPTQPWMTRKERESIMGENEREGGGQCRKRQTSV